jgi:hypothetical protein
MRKRLITRLMQFAVQCCPVHYIICTIHASTLLGSEGWIVTHNTGRCLRNISNLTGKQYADSVWKVLHLNRLISYLSVSLWSTMEVLWSGRETITEVIHRTITKNIAVVAQESQVEIVWPCSKNGLAWVITRCVSLGRQIREEKYLATEDARVRGVELGSRRTVVKNSQKPLFFVIKPTTCTNFTNLFCHETLQFRTVRLSIIGSLFTVHSAVV